MTHPTPYQLSRLALILEQSHTDQTQTELLERAYNLWDNARLCIEDRIADEDREKRQAAAEEFKRLCATYNLYGAYPSLEEG